MTTAVHHTMAHVVVDPKTCDLNLTAQGIMQISRVIAERMPSAMITKMNIGNSEAIVEVARARMPKSKKTIVYFRLIDSTWQINGQCQYLKVHT